MRMPIPALLVLLSGLIPAQDAERATHGDEAMAPQVSYEATHGSFTLRQYQLGCLSHLSYLLVSHGEAMVVDPMRDIDHYLSDAAKLGAKIRWVLLTHHHADFVAGHTEIAAKTGAKILVSKKANAAYPHEALADGWSLRFGTALIRILETPGHTPHTITALVDVDDLQVKPAYALTGDTLFVGSVGRPDLLDVPPAELASLAFDSIQKLVALPEATIVLPAHGAGSLCGAHLSPETTSTIGKERTTNPFLRPLSRASFVAEILSVQPIAPQYFKFNVELNQKGPPLVERSDELPARITGSDLTAAVRSGAWIVDLRDAKSYSAGHLEGAINISLRGRLDTWTGIVVPFGQAMVLVGSDAEVREGAFRLRRIGYDAPKGATPADAAAWRSAGLTVRASKLVSPKELAAELASGKEPLIVDVRGKEEHEDVRLTHGGNIPITEAERFGKTLDKSQPVLFVCNSAYRSSIAVGMAERQGFQQVASLDGGIDAWLDAKLPVVGRQVGDARAPSAQSAPRGSPEAIALPEPVEPSGLSRLLTDQPQGYLVLDVRPAWQFTEYSIPGSKNVTLDSIATLVRSTPRGKIVVIVDRDGTSAFAVAGALLARGDAAISKALVGGVSRWYREIELERGARAQTQVPGGAQTQPPSPAPTPETVKKARKAGC